MKGQKALPAGTSCTTEGCTGSAVQKFRRNQPVCPKCYVAAFEAFKEKLDLRCLELVKPRTEGEPCHIRCTSCKTTLAANVRPDELKVHRHTQPSAAAVATPTGQQRPTFLQCMLAHGPSPADLPWLNAPSQRIHTAALRGLPLLLISLTLTARRASEQQLLQSPTLVLAEGHHHHHHHPTFLVALKKWERLTDADASGYTIRSSKDFNVLPARDDTDGLFDLHLTDLGDGKVLLRIPTRIQERVYKVYGVGENAAAVLQADGSVKPWPVEYFYMLDGFTHAIADFEQASWGVEQLLDYRNAEPDLDVPVAAGVRGSRQLELLLGLTPQDPNQLRFADKVRELSQRLEALRNPECRWEAEAIARASFSSQSSSGKSGAAARGAAGERGRMTAAPGPQSSSLGAGPWPLGLGAGAGAPPTGGWPGQQPWPLEAGPPPPAMEARAPPPMGLWQGHQSLPLEAGLQPVAMGAGLQPWAGLGAALPAMALDAASSPWAAGTALQALLPGALIEPLAPGEPGPWPLARGPELLPPAVAAITHATMAEMGAHHVASKGSRRPAALQADDDFASLEALSAACRASERSLGTLAPAGPPTGGHPAAEQPLGGGVLGAAVSGVMGAAAAAFPALPHAAPMTLDEDVDEDEELAAQGLLDLSGGFVPAARRARPPGKRK